MSRTARTIAGSVDGGFIGRGLFLVELFEGLAHPRTMLPRTLDRNLDLPLSADFEFRDLEPSIGWPEIAKADQAAGVDDDLVEQRRLYILRQVHH